MSRYTLISITLALSACATTQQAVGPGQRDATGLPTPMVVDVASGELLSRNDVLSKLDGISHIYVSEHHTSVAHHRVQLDVLRELKANGADLAIGIEWLPAVAQPVLDKYVGGELNESDFIEQVKWKTAWGHSFKFYAPIFRWARSHGVPIWGLNAPTGLARAVGRGGPCNVPAALQPDLPPLDTGNKAHRAFFESMMRRVRHGHHGHHGHHRKAPRQHKKNCPHQNLSMMDRYYLAQLLRDESMSRNLALHLNSPKGQHKQAVIMAGAGHVAYAHGIPARARALLKKPFRIILPVEAGKMSEQHKLLRKKNYPLKRGDLLWEAPYIGTGLASVVEPEN